MTLQPPTSADPNELWPEALMDELLMDWTAKRFERLENWLKECSTQEMLRSLLSLKLRVSRNTRNRGIRTIPARHQNTPKVFCPATSNHSLEDFDDEMGLLQTRLRTALQKLSVAKCLPNATRCVPTPQAKYGVRLWCLLHASLAGERWLSDSAASLLTPPPIASQFPPCPALVGRQTPSGRSKRLPPDHLSSWPAPLSCEHRPTNEKPGGDQPSGAASPRGDASSTPSIHPSVQFARTH